jgi:PhnB protein
MAFHPYLNFGGNCREAFTRYQEIFGGELFVMPMSDVPDSTEVPAEQGDLIAHAALAFDGHMLMASDDPSPDFQPPRSMYVNYSVTDPSEAERVFAALADGGRVEMPIEETFWALRFGICVDRFGTPWMVNAERPQDA